MADKSPDESVEETQEKQSAPAKENDKIDKAKGKEETTSTTSKRCQILKNRKKTQLWIDQAENVISKGISKPSKISLRKPLSRTQK